MSATNFTPIQLYRTSTAAAAPTAGNLAAGELAINLTDEKLYFKNAAGVVKLLADSSGALGSVTSVSVSGGTTGLTTSGGPITSSGTITLAGTLGVANGGTGTATAFTAGSVVFAGASGVYSQDNANLFWDNTNDRLGIGTATPATRFHAFGGQATITSPTAGAVSYATREDGLYFTRNDLASIWRNKISNSWSGDASSTTMNFELATGASTNATVMSLFANGNVGIGTSSPGAKLSVAGGQINTVADETYGIALNATTGNTRVIPYAATYSGSVLVSYSAGYAGYGPFSIDASRVQFFTNGNERARIDSSGSLLVGKTSVSGLGEILGVNRASDGTTAMIGRSGGTNNPYARFIATDTGCLTTIDANGSAGSPQLAFSTNSAERMRIDSSGNVGIGTSSASGYKTRILGGNDNTLLIDNDGYQYTSAWFANNGTTKAVLGYNNGTSNFAILNTTASGNLLLGTVGAERMRIDSVGNVGIGVTPNAWSFYKGLQINDGALVDANNNQTVLSKNAYYNGSNWIYINSNFASFYQQFQGQHRWHTAASGTAGNAITFTQAMTLDSSGNVGIGTTTPAEKLSVAGAVRVHTTSSAGFTVDTKGGLFDFVPASNNVRVGYVPGTSGVNTGILTFVVGSGSEAMRINASGNVGIGTASPNAKLDVVDTSGSSFAATITSNTLGNTTLRFTNTNTGGGVFDVATGATGHFLFGFTALPLVFGTDGSERMRITSTGNVGIGTSSPLAGYRVDVAGSVNSSASFVSGGGTANQAQIGNKVLLFYNTSVSEGFIQSADDTSTFNSMGFSKATLRFLTSNAEQMRIDSTGNVGIGTSSPSNFTPFGYGPTVETKGGHGGSFIVTNGGGTLQTVLSNNATETAGVLKTTSNHPLAFLTNDTERARIDSSGNLLVGLTAAQGGVVGDPVGISLFGSSAPGTAVFTRDNVNSVLYVNNKTSGGGLVAFYNGGASVGSITSNGTNTTYGTASDSRLKKNIADADNAASLIDALQVRKFDWKSNDSHQRYGFIAQELLEVAPEAVSQPADPDAMMGVDYSKLVPMLVKEIQSLRARVAQLEGN